jgi:long-chain acyl-CoA synthetase
MAIAYAGAILVPVYETSSPSQIAYVLNDSGATAMITETADMFARFDEIRADVPGIGATWRLDLGDLEKLTKSGGDVTDKEIERRRKLAKGSDIATILYTSGSTGAPKGCVITHSNFVDQIRNSAKEMSMVVNTEASTLLFITAAHIFARVMSLLAIHAGVRVGHQSDTKLLLPSLQSFRPTFLLAVPRVFEKVYNSAEQKAEAGGKGNIFRLATKTAIAYSKALDAGRVPLGLRLQFAVLDRLVLSKLRAAMGGRVVYAVSGSAPLGLRLGHYYRALGMKVLEGYGLTETTAPVTINVPQKFKIGSVGPVLPGISARIAKDGEVLVKGINVFAGYWNNKKATTDSFVDGWYKTGDIGELDDDGYLWITGRIKEIIVTAGGKNVAPATLEDPIRANPLIGQCVVVGDQKPFIAALITLDSEMLGPWLRNNKLDPEMTVDEARNHPAVLAEVQKAIDWANTKVSRAESIRKFVILPTEFTEDSGHLTPKMSIKRHVIVADFASEIEELFSGNPETSGISVVG